MQQEKEKIFKKNFEKKRWTFLISLYNDFWHMNTNDTKLFSPNSRPKTVIMKFTRNTDGSYHLEQAKYVKRVNQHESYTQRVDARDAAAELRDAVRDRALTVR